MATYSITDLEKLSGIKAHTLRMWEQRYGILRPRRTENNTRFYGDEDLQILTHIALLNRHGWRISKIAGMSRQAIAEEVGALSQIKLPPENQWDVLTLAVVEMDEIKFSHLFDEQAQRLGFERAMLEMGFPFLEKLNLLLLTGSVKAV
ncbi:MAG: MerR family transcriptional regulator, partial [Bacteroidota bacterium]